MTTENTRNMCLDEAYELEAVKNGLERNPVFPSGQKWLKEQHFTQDVMKSRTIKIDRHRNGEVHHIVMWGEPPPKKNTNPPIKDLVSKDIKSRADMGFGKYGTYLQGNNGRNALKDAYEEALDLCMYLRQKLYEEQGK